MQYTCQTSVCKVRVSWNRAQVAASAIWKSGVIHSLMLSCRSNLSELDLIQMAAAGDPLLGMGLDALLHEASSPNEQEGDEDLMEAGALEAAESAQEQAYSQAAGQARSLADILVLP